MQKILSHFKMCNSKTISIVLLFWIATSQAVKWNGNWAMDCDFPEHDLANVTTKRPECGGRCSSTPKCTHFSWSSYNGGTCWMKYGTVSKPDAVNSEKDMMCGIIIKKTIEWNGNWAFNCDFPEQDLANVTIESHECGGRCYSTSECTHFSWSSYNGGTCWMKYGTVSKSDAISSEQGMVCGVVKEKGIDWVGSWASNCDFLEHDLANVKIKRHQCGGRCSSTPNCTHFSWSSDNGGTCWMKYGTVSKYDAISVKKDMMCGVIYEKAIKWNGNSAMDCDFPERDLTEAIIKQHECSGRCSSTPDCTHFTWNSLNGGTCWMKQGVVSKSDAIASEKGMICGVVIKKSLSKTSIITVAVLVPVVIVLAVVIAFRICIKKKVQFQKTNLHLKQLQNENKNGYLTDNWKISPNYIIFNKKVGQGAFGNVFIAKISSSVLAKTCYASQTGMILHGVREDSAVNVAVKLLKDDASQLEINDFGNEINLMKGIGYHKNIVNMIGWSTVRNQLCLVVEFMENGDLLNFLRNRRTKLIASISEGDSSKIMFTQNYQKLLEKTSLVHETTLVNTESMTPNDLICFAWQVASGMEYLSLIKLVHRDLAARNILVSADKKVKVSDFGLTRQVNDDLNYTSCTHRRLPVKWMSVEAIFDQKFTTYSDVWAYGVVLFEIVTLGGTPYPGLSNCELLARLKTGYRMERPDNCSQIMYDHMLHCWNEDPLKRPSFTELRELFEEVLCRGGHYFSFEINEKNNYYSVPSFNSISSDTNDNLQEKEFLQKPVYSVEEMN
ncbi:mast/stem cell growth factor receptor-related protein Kit isoform X1 [Hydra vulgaris]|uniref:mast/stem cell growth factor receptor-related protein Kit isoform X1 n=3 Tax=Hydra vulgaris TaxID=6087 RepID=UPI001F5F9A1E|nr:mast/stem cell growth factor receptor-related protein Kit [Hydra vulgaris]